LDAKIACAYTTTLEIILMYVVLTTVKLNANAQRSHSTANRMRDNKRQLLAHMKLGNGAVSSLATEPKPLWFD
jgi:hypothetical protein